MQDTLQISVLVPNTTALLHTHEVRQTGTCGLRNQDAPNVDNRLPQQLHSRVPLVVIATGGHQRRAGGAVRHEGGERRRVADEREVEGDRFCHAEHARSGDVQLTREKCFRPLGLLSCDERERETDLGSDVCEP